MKSLIKTILLIYGANLISCSSWTNLTHVSFAKRFLFSKAATGVDYGTAVKLCQEQEAILVQMQTVNQSKFIRRAIKPDGDYFLGMELAIARHDQDKPEKWLNGAHVVWEDWNATQSESMSVGKKMMTFSEPLGKWQVTNEGTKKVSWIICEQAATMELARMTDVIKKSAVEVQEKLTSIRDNLMDRLSDGYQNAIYGKLSEILSRLNDVPSKEAMQSSFFKKLSNTISSSEKTIGDLLSTLLESVNSNVLDNSVNKLELAEETVRTLLKMGEKVANIDKERDLSFVGEILEQLKKVRQDFDREHHDDKELAIKVIKELVADKEGKWDKLIKKEIADREASFIESTKNFIELFDKLRESNEQLLMNEHEEHAIKPLIQLKDREKKGFDVLKEQLRKLIESIGNDRSSSEANDEHSLIKLIKSIEEEIESTINAHNQKLALTNDMLVRISDSALSGQQEIDKDIDIFKKEINSIRLDTLNVIERKNLAIIKNNVETPISGKSGELDIEIDSFINQANVIIQKINSKNDENIKNLGKQAIILNEKLNLVRNKLNDLNIVEVDEDKVLKKSEANDIMVNKIRENLINFYTLG